MPGLVQRRLTLATDSFTIALQSEALRGFGIVSIANLGGKSELMLTVNATAQESAIHKKSPFFHPQSIGLQE